MIQETPQAERFKQQLRDSLLQETQSSSAIKIAKHDHVYTGVIHVIDTVLTLSTAKSPPS
ncbi:MAG: hypothetical protein MOB07_06260 [Acidobacteria bacterium]|nr:hypothetical protein [Acidobacteriota bacterium]